MSNRNTDLDFQSGWDGSSDVQDDLPSPLAKSADINFESDWVSGDTTIKFGQSAVGKTHTVYPSPFSSNGFGFLEVKNTSAFIAPRGIFSALAFAKPKIINAGEYLAPTGFLSQDLSKKTDIRNYNQEVLVRSWDSSEYGRPRSYNLLQYLKLQGRDQSKYGMAAMQGGVWYLYARGLDSEKLGKVQALNTTADQKAKPRGIDSLEINEPNVSPRILYARGFDALLFSTPDIRSPVLKPKSIKPASAGKPTIWYHTRTLAPNSINSFTSGYARAFDPVQFVYPSRFNRSAVFGDVAIKNQSTRVAPYSVYDGIVSPWTALTNQNRRYQPKGILSQAFGQTGIYNKTPSISPTSIGLPNSSQPAIAYRIRSVKPRGTDGLGFGLPKLTKTPELEPRGIQPVGFGDTTIWYKNRSLDLNQNGVNSFEPGEGTLWFRYRHIKAVPWLSSDFARPVLTHEVREVISKGFARDSYGISWVSRGLRSVAPIGIFKEYASNHKVGVAQYITANGFIATKFGERIIPERQSLSSIGFSGELGAPIIGFYTRHLRSYGFISVGQQPADRWGAAESYNSRQYITQEYDSNSGLAPPEWSKWQSIENRNKTVKPTNFNSQKFGYNQIDNTAAVIAPVGLSAFSAGNNMIAESVRYLSLQGLPPLPINRWGVVYNAARVITPFSYSADAYGNASIENTRRYYDRVGRIFSQDFGVPMIAPRIRIIDIERRYTIAPPLINLPSIDNLTKYVSFNGFESANYGQPSLFIRFNIIKTRWYHRDNSGYPYIYNVTPEVGQRGYDSQAFGNSAIRTQWREIITSGDRASIFGSHKISDTKQTIIVRGWQDGASSQKHKAIRLGAPPYSIQQISLDGYTDYSGPEEGGEYIPGYGISWNKRRQGKRVPEPGLNQNVLYQKGEDSSVFGSNKIHSNNIEVIPGIAIHNISSNHSIINRTRIIKIEKDNSIESEIKVGKLRLSPWTIYAVTESPAQARRNHDKQGQRLHAINSSGGNRSAGEVFGYVRVSRKNRVIEAHGSLSSRFEEPILRLRNRVISVKSFGENAIGLPSIPFSQQSITVFNKKEPMTVFGSTKIEIIDNRDKEVIVRGVVSQDFGDNSIELLNRNVKAVGLHSLNMGSKKHRDNPYMWQGLRVGAHIPTKIGAGDTSLHGDTMIGLRIRDISIQGFDSFISEYDTANFKKRMTVKRSNNKGPETRRVTTHGFVSDNANKPSIKWGQHFIKPDGNADQFRRSSYSAEFGAATISG